MFGLAWLFLSFVWWCALWYLFFYLRYENRHIVDELRRWFKQSNEDKQHFQEEAEEYKEQNDILKDKLTVTLQKNDDLSKVVSELSRYYYKIKLGSEKVKDLSRDLEIPDENMLDKMQHYMEENKVWDMVKQDSMWNNSFDNKTTKKDFF